MKTLSRAWAPYLLCLYTLVGSTGCEKEATSLSANSLINACATLQACGSYSSILYCIWDYEQANLSLPSSLRSTHNNLLSCYAGARSCLEASRCNATECTEFTPYCEGNSLVQCFNGYLEKVPCTEYPTGSSCLVDEQGYALCGDRTCTSAQEGSWCEGDVANTCEDGVLTRNDCRSLLVFTDGTCYDGWCEPRRTQVCDSQLMSPYCDGNVAVRCSWSGYIERIDCGVYPIHNRCMVSANDVECVKDGPYCEHTATGCVGSLLRICETTLWEFDCASIGATCEEGGYDGPYCHIASQPY